jgi:hypothetical protein
MERKQISDTGKIWMQKMNATERSNRGTIQI